MQRMKRNKKGKLFIQNQKKRKTFSIKFSQIIFFLYCLHRYCGYSTTSFVKMKSVILSGILIFFTNIVQTQLNGTIQGYEYNDNYQVNIDSFVIYKIDKIMSEVQNRNN